jgi:hypothetical protein
LGKAYYTYLDDDDCRYLTPEQQKWYDGFLKENIDPDRDGILQRRTEEIRRYKEKPLTDYEPAPIIATDPQTLIDRERIYAYLTAPLDQVQRAVYERYQECGTYAGTACKMGWDWRRVKRVVKSAEFLINQRLRKYIYWWLVYWLECIPRHIPDGLL